MLFTERVEALRPFGYDEVEAAFLATAALTSGYFLRRQFATFAGCKQGRRDSTFAAKLVRNGHGKLASLRHNRLLYHLSSKPLYEALGATDNRNRRHHHVFTIKNRVMALDFVLQHESDRLLVTESEKVSYFCDERGMSRSELPTRTYSGPDDERKTHRFFVEKQPILVSPPASPGGDPVVTFSFVDEGLHSSKGFEAFLLSYRNLMRRIVRSQLVYVACSTVQIPAVQRIFDRVVGAAVGQSPLVDVERIAAFFADREAYERRDFTEFSQQRLIRFRQEKSMFDGPIFDQLFAVWRSGGRDAVRVHLRGSETSESDLTCEFRHVILPHKYELFGTLGVGEWAT